MKSVFPAGEINAVLPKTFEAVKIAFLVAEEMNYYVRIV